jgi:hypothetical protein
MGGRDQGGEIMAKDLAIMATRPSAGRLASKDISFLFLIMGLTTPVLLMAVTMFIAENSEDENDVLFLGMAAAAVLDAAVGIGFYLIRWRYFSNFLTTATEAPGEVSFVSLVGEERSLEYKYKYLGRDYNVANKYGALSSKRRQLKVGDRITVLLNPEKPSESLILDIYV